MSEYPEKNVSVAFVSETGIIESLISDAVKELNANKEQLRQTIEEFEAKIAWLREERLRKVKDVSEKECQPTKKSTVVQTPSTSASIDSTEVGDQSNRIGGGELHAGMKLSEAVRTAVRLSGAAGAKTNDVAQALAQVGHPVASAPDLSKRVGSALCALKPSKTPSKRKTRAGKHELYRDDETGRFYSPEAWFARQS